MLKLTMAILVGLGGLLASEANAAYILLNHPGGNAGGNYGVRIDLSGKRAQTFNFEEGGASVALSFDSVQNTGLISGVVLHNQSDSGDLWSLEAKLEVHNITTNATPWTASSNLDGGIVDDLIANADSVYGVGTNLLKLERYAADRLAFEVVSLEMKYIGPGATADYVSPGQPAGTISLGEYPSGLDDGMLPFMLVKGHRDKNDPIVGLGWLSDSDYRGPTRDFLFEVAPHAPIPEPGAALLFPIGAMIVAGAVARRRKSQGDES